MAKGSGTSPEVRVPLTRERVLRAAMRVADADGIEGCEVASVGDLAQEIAFKFGEIV